MLISKSDLDRRASLEFFDDLDKNGREQVWGATFPAGKATESPVSLLREGVPGAAGGGGGRACRIAWSNASSMSAGRSRRAALAGFPAQFAALKRRSVPFSQAGFAGTRLEPAPFLRGFYFTSGTQEGSPSIVWPGAMARSFGLDARRPASVMGQKGRPSSSASC